MNGTCKDTPSRGFTLIELLVVIAIIAIMAAMLLPVLSSAKQKVQITQCLHNLHQIGLANHMYADDNSGTLPCRDSNQSGKPGPFENYAFGLGGNDPATNHAFMAAATNRPLHQYLSSPLVCRCPADKGQDEGELSFFNDDGCWQPSNYEALGCSYRLNAAFWGNGTLQVPDDPQANLAGKKVSWVPAPVSFIMMHEPPAFWYAYFYHWHYARGPTRVTLKQLARDNQKFISPILFVDGHAARHDFTRVLKEDPMFPMEPTRDWVWYKPKDPQPPP